MNYKKIILFAFLNVFSIFIFLSSSMARNQYDIENLDDTVVVSINDSITADDFSVDIIQNNPIVDMLDSLTFQIFSNEGNDATFSNLNLNIPYFADSVYSKRMSQLNNQSPFKFEYNEDVKRFINLYAYNRRELMSRILGLSKLYFPLFEEILDKYNLPLELKYLAIVESALSPVAKSRVGAAGLWQFMYQTGKLYDLKVTSYTDDRNDPFKATDAACRHFVDLYKIYGDWCLVLAAYNSGAGNVNKAIRRAGGVKDFWKIKKFLPRETRGYVPAFMAVNYVYTFAKEHNITPKVPTFTIDDIDTVTIHSYLTTYQVAEALKIPIDELSFLNPAYKKGIIPASEDQKYILRLPKKYVGDFVTNEEILYKYNLSEKMQTEFTSLQTIQKIHIVGKNENIRTIARRYHCTVSDIKVMNNLKSNYISYGQKIIVEVPFNEKYSNKIEAVKTPVSNNGFYIVQDGDNLGNIARTYNCSVDDLKTWNNMSTIIIKPGQQLKVKAPVAKIEIKPKTILSKTSSTNNNITYHVVQKGDTMWGIATKYNISVDELKKLNNINNNSLIIGSKLKIKAI